MALLDLLGALKSKEFKATIDGAINNAGKWGVWVSLILASGLVLAFSNAEAEWAIGVLVAEVFAALGVQVVVPKLNKEKSNEKDIALPNPDATLNK